MIHPFSGARAALLVILSSFAVWSLSAQAPVAVRKSEAEVQMEFGAKMAQKGSWREAAFRFEKAVLADAENPRAFNNLAVARESLGMIEEARDAYEQALALAPDDQRIRMNYERFLNHHRTRLEQDGGP